MPAQWIATPQLPQDAPALTSATPHRVPPRAGGTPPPPFEELIKLFTLVELHGKINKIAFGIFPVL